MVLEFFDKSQMDKLLDNEFNINNKTEFNEYYRQYNKTIGNTRVWVIDDSGLYTRTYFFNKNGTYYMVDVLFKDKYSISDYPSIDVIKTIKSS
jgi:C4-dicarboxylate-specific signal transduction histidine kinase